MPSRSPRAATQDFLEPLREMLRCITDDGFVARGSQPGSRHRAMFQQGVVELRRRQGFASLHLMLVHEYTIDEVVDRRGWWQATTVGWIYDILDHNGRIILAFHWHPHESGRVTWPHLHAYGTNESVDLHKLHPPTGTVTAGSVVRFLVEDLDVLPRRPNWQAVLDRHAAV